MLLLALTSLALAEPAPPADAKPELSIAAGYSRARWYEDYSTGTRRGIEAAALLRFEPGWELEGGARWLLYDYTRIPPFDLFVCGRASPAIGPWRPAAGLELGFTTSMQRDYLKIATESFGETGVAFSEVEARDDADWFYVQAVAEPLRFRVSRFTISAGSVALGGALPHFGPVTRVELGFARVEVAL
ncbi:MAG: hypothetical protein H6740_11040 [Alphaproteobacteria bacterium]|nr:hypothetical protein [Alphaproteobacteria bacterium]